MRHAVVYEYLVCEISELQLKCYYYARASCKAEELFWLKVSQKVQKRKHLFTVWLTMKKL